MTDADDAPWPDPHAAEQARALLPQAREGGLRFDAYLPPALAEWWLLEHVAQGRFKSPGEAMFVLLDEGRELEPHADLRAELLRRRLQAAVDDPRPSVPAEEVMTGLRTLTDVPRPEPAVWRQPPRDER